MREMAVQSFQQRMCSARPEVSGCAATQGVMAGAAETPGTNDCNMDCAQPKEADLSAYGGGSFDRAWY